MAAGRGMSLTATPTPVPNRGRLTITVSGLNPGDIVDIQVVNRDTGP